MAKIAGVGIDPVSNAMATARLFAKPTFGESLVTGLVEMMDEQAAKVKKSDLSAQRGMLTSQAVALVSIFTELARRSAANFGEYVTTAEIYL